jgi:hypothetical protein
MKWVTIRSKPLDRRERYRNNARRCAATAIALRQASERVAILQIAQSWMKLADHTAEHGAMARDNAQSFGQSLGQPLLRGADAATAPRTPKISR